MRTHIQLENINGSEFSKEYQNDAVRYSESLVEYFMERYTQKNYMVFDPFEGFGTTLMVAESMERIPFGIEYDEDRVHFIKSKLKQLEQIIQGDSRQ